MRKASVNFFKEQDTWKPKTPVQRIKGQESFPQPFRRQKLRDRSSWRHKTQPVTSRELNAILEVVPDQKQCGKEDLLLVMDEVMIKQEEGKNVAPCISTIDSDQPEVYEDAQETVPDAVPFGAESTVPVTLDVINSPISSEITSSKLNRQRTLSGCSSNRLTDSDDDFDKLVEINFKEIVACQQEEKPGAILETPLVERSNIFASKDEKDPESSPKGSKATSNIEHDTEGKEESAAEDNMSRMSLSDKMSFFQELDNKAALSESHFAERKKRLARSKTQPLVVEDVTQASELAAKQQQEGAIGHSGSRTQNSRPKSMIISAKSLDEGNANDSESEDELSR